MKKKKSIKKKKVVTKKAKRKSAPKRSKKVAKKSVKRPVAKKAPKVKSAKPKSAPKNLPKPTYIPAAGEILLGKVEDYFGHIGVIALNIKESLSIGDTIHVRGHTTDITQKVDSMQINLAGVQAAKRGDSVGIKVNDKCRKGDKVFRVS